MNEQAQAEHPITSEGALGAFKRAVKRKAHGRNTVFPSVTKKRQHVLGAHNTVSCPTDSTFILSACMKQTAHIIQKEGGREYIKTNLFSCHPPFPIYSHYYQIFNPGQYLYL